MVANLRRFLRERTAAEDFREGGVWYSRFHGQLVRVAEYHDMPISAVVGAFAALSPNDSLEGNLRSLVTCIHAVKGATPEHLVQVTTYNRMRKPALRILGGSADFSDLCKGDKITAFRHNLLFPGSSPRVTIDGHMISIMAGQSLTMKDAEMWKRKVGGYAALERAFRRFARAHCLDTLPCDLQAVMWVAARRSAKRRVEPWRHIHPREIQPYPFTEAS